MSEARAALYVIDNTVRSLFNSSCAYPSFSRSLEIPFITCSRLARASATSRCFLSAKKCIRS